MRLNKSCSSGQDFWSECVENHILSIKWTFKLLMPMNKDKKVEQAINFWIEAIKPSQLVRYSSSQEVVSRCRSEFRFPTFHVDNG